MVLGKDQDGGYIRFYYENGKRPRTIRFNKAEYEEFTNWVRGKIAENKAGAKF